MGAVEPFEENHMLHQHTLCMNPSLRRNVQLLDVGLHYKDNITCSLYQNPDYNRGDTHVVCGDSEPEYITSVYEMKKLATAHMRTLNMLMREGTVRIKSASILKIDVEGFEPFALKGATDLLSSDVRPRYILSEYSTTMMKQRQQNFKLYATPKQQQDSLANVTLDYVEFMEAQGYKVAAMAKDNEGDGWAHFEPKDAQSEVLQQVAAPLQQATLPPQQPAQPLQQAAGLPQQAALKQSAWQHCSTEACCEPFFKNRDHVVVTISKFAKQPFSLALRNSSDLVSAAIKEDREWEGTDTTLILDKLNDTIRAEGGATFIDIGANVGWFTYVVASHGIPVVALEPFEENHMLHQHTLCMNPSLRRNVQLLDVGLHYKDNITCSLYQNPDYNRGDTHVVCGDSEPEYITSVYEMKKLATAHMRTLNMLMREGTVRIKSASILKIDVEGFEPFALKGATDLLSSDVRPRYILSEYSTTMMKQRQQNFKLYATPKQQQDSLANVTLDYVEFMEAQGYKVVAMAKDNEGDGWAQFKPKDAQSEVPVACWLQRMVSSCNKLAALYAKVVD